MRIEQDVIRINGKPSTLSAGITVHQLIRLENYDFPLLFVRVNREVVNKSKWKDYRIPENAEVEIVPIVAGG
jgi:thiamine biosynthesis protein ThiS